MVIEKTVRDISVHLLDVAGKTEIKFALPLAWECFLSIDKISDKLSDTKGKCERCRKTINRLILYREG